MTTTATDNLILEQLRNLRNDIADFKQYAKDEFFDVKQRLSNVEMALASVRRDIVHYDEVDARQQITIDRIVSRLERIEKRLDLHEQT